MRLEVLGECDSAKVLAGYLTKAGYIINRGAPNYKIMMTEDEKIEKYTVIVDGIDCDLERMALHEMETLGVKTFILERGRAYRSDRELKISFPSYQREAVEIGVLKAVLRELRVKEKHAEAVIRELKVREIDAEKITAKTPWYKHLFASIAFLCLLPLSLQAQTQDLVTRYRHPSLYVTKALLFQPANNFPVVRFWSGTVVVNAGDSANNALRVNVVAGAGSGGTASTFGAAFPATGTAAGFSDGTNMQGGRVFDLDTGGGTEYNQGISIRIAGAGGSTALTATGTSLNVNCTAGCGGASSFADNSAFTFGTTAINPTGFVVDDTATNAVTENSAGAPRMSASRVAYSVLTNTTGANFAGIVSSRLDINLGSVGSGAVATVATGVQNVSISDQVGSSFVSAALGLNSAGSGLQASQIIAQFDDTVPTTITENQFGNVRFSSNRNLYFTLRDAAGNERGANVTAGNALLVDGSATTQPISGTVTANAGTGTFIVGDGAGALNVIVDSGTVTANAGTNLNTSALALETSLAKLTQTQGSTTSGQSGPLIQGAVTTAAPTYTTAQTNPISLNTSGGLRVDGSGVTQPISGTVTANAGTNLNTSALATSANQTTEITALQLIDNLPNTIGSTTSGQSGALTLGAVTTSAPTYTTAQSHPLSLDTSGSLRVTGSGGGTQYAEDTAHVTGDTITLAGVVQQSADTALSGDGDRSLLQVDASGFLKVDIKAGSIGLTDDAAFTVATDKVAPFGAVADETTPDSVDEGDIGLVRMGLNRVLYGEIRDGLGNERGASVTAANALKVDGSAVTQPVSGTVTVTDGAGALNVIIDSGTTAVTQATASSLNAEVQGDAASGAAKSGNPVQIGGVFNTTQPTVTTGQVVEAQATARGALIVATGTDAFTVAGTVTTTPPANASTNVAQFGGTNVSTGTGAGGAGIPRVTISNDSSLAANQSTNTAQMNGVAVTMGNGISGTGVQRVTIASDSTGQVTLATGANTIGALTANQSVNMAQVAGTNTVTGGVAGSQGVGGLAASGATKAGNPLQDGGVFNTTPPTVTTGQAVEAQYTARGEAHTVIRDAAGNIRGANVTAGNALQGDITSVAGTAVVTGGTAGTLGVGGNLADDGAAAATNRVATLPAISATTYPTFTAGRNEALRQDTRGLLWTAQLPAMFPASYHVSNNAVVGAASATDIYTITGNATTTTLVTKLKITCTQTTAGIIQVLVVKRSTADTAGTSANETEVPDDSNYAAASTTVLSYSANPTLGSLIASIDTVKLGCLATGTAAPNDIYIGNWTQKPIVLRGTAQVLAVNLNGVTVTGNSFAITFEWIEI